MEKPAIIQKAQTLMYGTITVSIFCVFLNTVAGPVQSAELIANLVFSALLSLLPFFMGRRINAARYIYVAVIAFSAVFIFSTGEMIQNSGRFDLYVSVLLLPIEIYACGLLFRSESRNWFKKAIPAK